ncbi:MAG: DNA-protecting protein DprA, partial [Desulfobacterales bacterium]|nr:DNA-protecting protein DprA [Desulfobacterales bacterium]
YPAYEPTKKQPTMDKIQTMVYKNLDLYPEHIDHITASSGLTSAQVSAALLDLELSGLIVRHPGNKFSILEE